LLGRIDLSNFIELQSRTKLNTPMHEQKNRKAQTLYQGKSSVAGLGDCYRGIYVLLRIADVQWLIRLFSDAIKQRSGVDYYQLLISRIRRTFLVRSILASALNPERVTVFACCGDQS